MEPFTIRPLPGGTVELTGPLGIVDRLELGTAREAALHAQFCAMGEEATLHLLNEDGTLKNERPIPPRKRDITDTTRHQRWF